ncbi:MAG: RNA-guided endonuclease TnpB family protein [Candidatus Paceibacterota bacterium]
MKAYKVRLELNNKQKTWCNRCAGASRFVYNWGLSEWKRQYDAYKEDNTLKRPSRYGLCVQFNSEKDVVCKWIREYPYAITEAAFECLGKAFDNFFTRIKKGDSKLGYPKFKNRYSRKTFRLRGVKVESDRVFLPKLGWIRLSQTDYIPVGASYGIYATISERAGHWYISVLVKDETEVKADLNNTVIGIDFGIESLAVLSNGKVFDNPKPLREAQSKLKRLQRELSRRNKGGSNYAKTKARLAKANFTVAKIREHTLHQISSYITNICKPSVIVLEDLNVSGMLKNHCLAQSVSDVGFYELRRQIEYKAIALGIKVVFVDRWFPSSKTCSNCGCIKDDLTLGDRTFVCNDCGLEIDRDLNAAINLRNMVSVVE